ncbi:VOC family protein [Peribacillus sp. SCS-26]|uniref:VOC family protein n=1 Tax=Paraperibacillus marinus TaxID=3115295 RepID=UPI003906544F
MKSPVQNKMNTVFIHVTDLKKSALWYGRLLGQEVDEDRVSHPVYNLEIDGPVGLTLDAGPKPGKAASPAPYPLFNFHTNDIKKSFDYVQSLNIECDSGIVEFDDFSFFTVKDPDGNIIMVCTG